MNRIFKNLLVVVMLLLLIKLPVSAYDFEVNGIYYDITSFTDFTCAVTNGEIEYCGDITIPSEISYNSRILKVTGIRSNAFKDCEYLISIICPNSLKEIGSYAFCGCKSLTSITIPDGITIVADYTFRNCSLLASLSIPASVTKIGDYAFSGCSSLTSLSIPDGVTEIGDYAFSGCRSLTSLSIPDGVTEIGKFGFSGCYNLESVVLSNNITILRLGLFSWCKALNSLTLPGSIKSVELGSIRLRWMRRPYYGDYIYQEYVDGYSSLFELCDNLKEIRFEYGNKPITAKEYYDAQKQETYEPIQYWKDVSFELMYYKLVNQYYLPEEIPLPISHIYLDREFYTNLSLPNLKELSIGDRVEKVCIRPYDSHDLETIYCYAKIPPVAPDFTNEQYINLTVKVPKESFAAYQEADVWKNFWNLTTLDDSGVDDVLTDVSIKEVGRYDLNGRYVTSNYKGIIIVRYSDGSTRKIINR